MKKFIGISLILSGFFMASCEKEQITPTVTPSAEAPVWKKATVAPSGSTNAGNNGASITDPSNDPDISSPSPRKVKN